MTNNCWLHNIPTTENDEEGKKPKKMKEHAGWKDNNNYQQNIGIILAPTKKELDFAALTTEKEELLLKFQQKDQENKTKQEELKKIEKELTELKSNLEEKEQRILALRGDRDELVEKLGKKDDRIVQQDQTLKGSALIFQYQINIIDELTKNLEQQKGKNTDNTDYQSHLQEDIKRLAEERKDLTSQLKKLSEEEEKNKILREKELTNLRTRLTQKDTEINDWRSLSNYLTKPLIEYLNLGDSIPSFIAAKNLKKAILAMKTDLDKEKGWWDKFSFANNHGEVNADDNAIWEVYNQILINEYHIYDIQNKLFTVRFDNLGEQKRISCNSLRGRMHLSEILMIKAIYEYYKNK